MPGAVDAKAINIHMSVTGPFAAQMARNGQAVQTFGSQANAGMAKAQSGAASFGATASKIATGGAVAIAVGLALSAKAAITFESSFAGVRKTVDTTEEGFQRLSDGIRKLATEIPVGVNELNRIAELGGQLGVDAPDLLEFTETIALIGVTTTLATEEAATGFARLDNIMQLGQDSFEEMGSTIVGLGNNFAATEDEILNFALRVAPIGATVGLATDEVLAIATAFTSVGVRAERGGTAIQKTFIEIAEAAKTGGEELDTFARVTGMTAEEFARLAETDPAEAFEAFIIGLSEVDDAGGNVFATLDSLHLGNSRVVQSLLAMANASGVLTDALDSGNSFWEDNNALVEEAEKRFETTASQLSILKNNVIDVGIAIGSELLPFVNDFAAGLGEILNWVLDLSSGMKTMIAVIGGVSIALTLLATGHPIILGLAAVAGAIAFIGHQAQVAKQRVETLQMILEEGVATDLDLDNVFGEDVIADWLKLGFSRADIKKAFTGTERDFQEWADEMNVIQSSLLTNDTAGLSIAGVDDVNIGLMRAYRRELAGVGAEAKVIESARIRAKRYGASGPGFDDERKRAEDARSDVQAIFHARQGLVDDLSKDDGIIPALLTSEQKGELKDSLSDYVSVFTEAFADVRGELLGQINAFYEFEDDFALAWGSIVETSIRQTDALVAFNQFFLTHNVNAGVEEFLRANLTTAQQMEQFIIDFQADPAAMWRYFREIQTGVTDRIDLLAAAMVLAEIPNIEFEAGDELLDKLAGIALAISEDDLYNPLQAWLAVIGATDTGLSAERFGGFADSLKASLTDPAFLEAMGLSISEAQTLINLLDELDGKTVTASVVVDFDPGVILVNGRPVPPPGVRTPEPGDASFNAFGGTVMKGEPTWVGELGKEIFVPFSNGTIIPNSKLGGGDTEYNLNVYGSTNTADDAAAVLLTAQMIGKM